MAKGKDALPQPNYLGEKNAKSKKQSSIAPQT